MSGKSYTNSINPWEIVGKVFTSVILGTILALLFILIVFTVFHSGNELPPDQDAKSTFQSIEIFYIGCFLLPLQIIAFLFFSFLSVLVNRCCRIPLGKALALSSLLEFIVVLLLMWSWLRWLASTFDENIFTSFEYLALISWYLFVPLAIFLVILVVPYWQRVGYDKENGG